MRKRRQHALPWHKSSRGAQGSFERYATLMASGLVAGQAMVGSILMPALAALSEWIAR